MASFTSFEFEFSPFLFDTLQRVNHCIYSDGVASATIKKSIESIFFPNCCEVLLNKTLYYNCITSQIIGLQFRNESYKMFSIIPCA